MSDASARPRLLTGDTPTGRLHLGHLVGSLENRLALQDGGGGGEYDCFFLVANKHAFTTRAATPGDIRASVFEIVRDWIAVGLDPQRSSFVLQSEVPAIDELTFFFSMLLPFNRVMRNPTLKQELAEKGMEETFPFGFPLYAVGQTADILAFRPKVVPVGEDQLPHLEMTREVARKFGQLYASVDSHADDADYASRSVFPVIEPKLGRVKRLVGLGPPNEQGVLPKMSKSLNNALFLGDNADTIKKKVMGMYTDPNRVRKTDPGEIDPAKNPLWAMHETFNEDGAWVEQTRAAYAAGQVGDVDVKRRLIEVLDALIAPIRDRRASVTDADVVDALRSGTARANTVAEETLQMAKEAMKQNYFGRSLQIR
jgi:tryptophanyl-tRNA synthetase